VKVRFPAATIFQNYRAPNHGVPLNIEADDGTRIILAFTTRDRAYTFFARHKNEIPRPFPIPYADSGQFKEEVIAPFQVQRALVAVDADLTDQTIIVATVEDMLSAEGDEVDAEVYRLSRSRDQAGHVTFKLEKTRAEDES
jgi:hypothetical protein